MRRDNRELLAPAGNMTCLHAAVTAGADAVYLGVGDFNARRGADNFTLETLGEACDYAHLRGVQVYLTLNTAILPSEIFDAVELARQAYRCGVDAFIVQDIGLADEIQHILPRADLHISTQMNTHSVAGLEAAHQLGAKRVTLAREMSMTEIAHLSTVAQQLDLDIEVFAHGALCVCYSGQCFMSSMIGGRSANRGLCAQACRLPYTLHNKALRKTLPAEGEHLLSPKDLCAIELLPQLLDAGVSSFKIEGRMKSAEYVYAVTSIYRRALDRALAGQTEVVTEDDKFALAEVFSRGFTTAYLEGHRGNEIMSYGRPNNRGVFVGRVSAVAGSTVSVAFEKEILIGDMLEFWTSKGHFTHQVDEIISTRDGDLRFTIMKAVGKGDRVFRVRSAKAAFEDDSFSPRIPLVGSIEMKREKPLRMYFALASETTGEKSASIAVEGPIVEAARTKAVTEDEVREHVNRLGNTPFTLEELTVDLGEGLGIGFSQLHKVRARALEELQEAILEPYQDRVLEKTADKPRRQAATQKGCLVVAWATNPACARAAKRAGADYIYTPALFYKRGQAVIAGQVSETAESAGYPKQSVMALPVVDHDLVEGSREFTQEVDVWQYVREGKPVFVENLGQMRRALDEGALVEIGPHLPILNSLSLQKVADQGVKRVWLSPELSLNQIEDMGKNTPVPLGLVVAGSQELMTTEHCFLMSQGPCSQDCFACQRRKSPHYLKDRKGYEFPLITDCCGRSHLYNAVEFEVAHAVPDLIRAGVSALMVDATMMNVAETKKAVERTIRARDIALKSGDKVSKKEGATTGHLFRGIS